MPTLFTLFGLRFYFYSAEHLPIHIHIENADGRAKVNVVPDVVLVYNKGIKPNDLKKAMQIVAIYQEEIAARWNEFHG